MFVVPTTKIKFFTLVSQSGPSTSSCCSGEFRGLLIRSLLGAEKKQERRKKCLTALRSILNVTLGILDHFTVRKLHTYLPRILEI